MAISSGRRGNKPYEEYEEQEPDPNSFWQWFSDPVGIDAEFVEYSSRPYTSSGYRNKAKTNTKTYSSGYSKCGGASNFPRKNFSRR